MNLYEKLELILKRASAINKNSDDKAVAHVVSDLGLACIEVSDFLANLEHTHETAILHQYSVRNIGPEYPEFHESLRSFREEIDYVRETLSEARKHE